MGAGKDFFRNAAPPAPPDALDYNTLLKYLMSNQTFAAGEAGRNAGALALSRGYDPRASIQHAQAGVYGGYAPEFGKLPLEVYNSQSQNFNQRFDVWKFLQQLQMQKESQDNGLWGDIGGALGGIGGAFLSPLGTATGNYLGRKLFK